MHVYLFSLLSPNLIVLLLSLSHTGDDPNHRRIRRHDDGCGIREGGGGMAVEIQVEEESVVVCKFVGEGWIGGYGGENWERHCWCQKAMRSDRRGGGDTVWWYGGGDRSCDGWIELYVVEERHGYGGTPVTGQRVECQWPVNSGLRETSGEKDLQRRKSCPKMWEDK